MSRRRARDPFAALGLTRRGGVSDDEVRAAWRRIAAATHPDRADGGDPARFAEAAAAYTSLRTAADRAEALADLSEPPGPGLPRPGRWAHARVGRPARLALRVAAAAAVGAVAAVVAGWQPATPALITGAATWLLLTARRDLAPRR